MINRHKFTVSRADGESMGDFTFFGADGPDDWSQIEPQAECDEEPTEYQIEEWVCVGRWTKTFDPRVEDDEPDYDPSLTVRTVTVGGQP